MTHINITKFVPINYLKKDHSMIEKRRLKNVIIFIQTLVRTILIINILVFILKTFKLTPST